jgi:hypothetical protein
VRLARAAAGVALLALLAAGAWLWRDRRCPARCDAAVAQAEHASDPAAALRLIDATDAACDCARFTEGDEPPEYAAARVAARALDEAALARAHAAARGPIVREVTRP